ncbi:MAG: hypothetical protein AB7E79_01095 [Rhodospirillaceae bacterium]
MLILLDTRTEILIAKFVDEKIARIAARTLSRALRRPLTLALNEAAKIPIARYCDGEEVHTTATIHYLT